jgi:hypothetical protein
MVAPTDYDDLSGKVRALIIRRAPLLERDSLSYFDDLLDHDEFGEALFSLVWKIFDENQSITQSELDDVHRLALDMEMVQELPETLAQLVDREE